MTLPKLDTLLKRKEKDPATLKGGKPFVAVRNSRFVLFVGDEGAVLIYLKGREVLRRQFLGTDAGAQNMTELRNALAQDSHAPIMMIVDTLDQTYVQQTLPPVSSLSVGRLIKRRLDRDFTTTKIKGAVVLGREQAGRKDWNFMMVGIEDSPQITRWLEFLEDLPNRFEGIYLVAVEAEIFIQAIEYAMGLTLKDTASEWKFLVSHNKVGGFRQVILRNNRIIFTRLAQPIGESTPEVIAGNIEQEIISTTEYMRRLAFNPQAGLDLYIVASGAVKGLIDKNKFNATHTYMMTPYEMAQHLGIEGATQASDQFGDVVLAAAIGCSRRHVLKLTTPQSTQLDMLNNARMGQRAAAALVGAGLICYTGSMLLDMGLTHFDSSSLEEEREAQQQAYTKLRAEIADSKLDVEKAGDMINLYNDLKDQELSPLPFIARVETVIHAPIVVKGFEWTVDGNEPTASNSTTAVHPTAPPRNQMKITALLTLQFPGVTTLDEFKTVSKKILDDLQQTFNGYDIKFTKLPTAFSENEKVDITFGNSAVPSTPGVAPDVQLSIRGPALLADNPPAAAPSPPVQEGTP